MTTRVLWGLAVLAFIIFGAWHGYKRYLARKKVAEYRRSLFISNRKHELPPTEDYTDERNLHLAWILASFIIGMVIDYLIIENNLSLGFIVISWFFFLSGAYVLGRIPWIDYTQKFEDKQKAQFLEPLPEPAKEEEPPAPRDPLEFKDRLEHMMIVASPGMGKTSLFGQLIAKDVKRACSIVVFDSQGDLVDKIVRLDIPRERVVLIDPTDVEHPPALSLFDLFTGGETHYERERNYNKTVALLLFVLESTDSSVTSKQRLPLEMLIRLCLTIPDATLLTLRDLLTKETYVQYRPFIQKLPDTARLFFEHEYMGAGFNDTRDQIKRRIYTILSVGERMFTATENKLKMRELLDNGSIILVNTAIDFLEREGSAFFTRFLTALIFQAIQSRNPTVSNTPVYLYIDEAGVILTEQTIEIFEQGRKYGIGMHVAFQNLHQLSTNIQHRIIGSTAIKCFAGNAKDARALAEDMKTDSETLMQAGKLHFAIHERGGRAQMVPIQPGVLDKLPRRDDLKQLLAENRAKYAGVVRPPRPHQDDSESDIG